VHAGRRKLMRDALRLQHQRGLGTGRVRPFEDDDLSVALAPAVFVRALIHRTRQGAEGPADPVSTSFCSRATCELSTESTAFDKVSKPSFEYPPTA